MTTTTHIKVKSLSVTSITPHPETGDKGTPRTLLLAADVRQGAADLPTLSGLGKTWRTNQRAESETLNHSHRRGGGASDLQVCNSFTPFHCARQKTPIISEERVEKRLMSSVYIQIFFTSTLFITTFLRTRIELQSLEKRHIPLSVITLIELVRFLKRLHKCIIFMIA